MMQQNINPQNENEKSTETNITMNQKILKIKGKPFWLNISANKRKTYSRFKTQSQSSLLDETLLDNHESKQKLNPQDDQESCAQSIQNFNQNYEEDFESYKSTINRQNNQEGKLPFFQSNKSHGKNINLQISRLEISIFKTRQKRQNAIILRHKVVESIQKNHKKNIKTEPSQKKQESFTITRQIFMNQSTVYLRNENEKVIRKIQELRKILPVMMKNDHQLSQQQIQLRQLKDKINRILSVEYEFQLDQNKLEIKIHQKQLEHSIKEILSSKHDKKPLTVINDHTIVPPSKIAVLREQVMNKIRLSCLRQEKNNHLTKKINLYEEINEKISAKLRLQSFNTLQNRKSFLQWDFKRLKNEIDLRIIQQKVQLQSLKDQIRVTDLKISQNNQILLESQNYPLPGAKYLVADVPKIQRKPQSIDQMREQIQLVQESNKAVKTLVFKKKIDGFYTPTKNRSNTSHTNDPFILQKQKNQQKHFSLLASPSLRRVHESKANSFEKQQSLRKKKQLEQCNRNLNIRIKKSNFHHEDMSQELEELKL